MWVCYQVEDRAIEVGLGVPGIDPDRLVVFGDGLVVLRPGLPGVAAVVVGGGVPGIDPDRRAVVGDGLVVADDLRRPESTRWPLPAPP